jgi:hypothetical protein
MRRGVLGERIDMRTDARKDRACQQQARDDEDFFHDLSKIKKMSSA